MPELHDDSMLLKHDFEAFNAFLKRKDEATLRRA
jgi:hypothetical protein